MLPAALALAACGGAPTPSPAPPSAPEPAWLAAVREAQHRAETGALTYEHVEGLTDAAGPRLAGSPGDPLAVAWGIARMQEIGLANVHAEPVTVHVWERGEERVDVISPVPQRLAAAALGGSVGTPEGGIEADVVRVESLDALRTLPEEQAREVLELIDKLEQDDDVQKVFHTLV